MPNKLDELRRDLNKLANPEKAKQLAGYFKTGKGEYGEGDIFLGIIVPKQRKIAKEYVNLYLNDLRTLLASKVHEERLIALLILTYKFKDKEISENERKEIFDFYLREY